MAKNFDVFAKRGSDHSDRRLRLFDFVEDRSFDSPPSHVGQPGIIGYPFDLGVERNNGRMGAKGGPGALRRSITNLAWHRERPIADLGDVAEVSPSVVTGSNYFETSDAVASSQSSLFGVVSTAIEWGYFPVVLGGGHDLAAATTSAAIINGAKSKKSCAIVNFDAHFDLRRAPAPNSGTGFLQSAEICSKVVAIDSFNYFVIGVAESSNTTLLFETANSIGAKFILDRDVDEKANGFIDDVIDSFDAIYISVDLDSIESSSMKAVSAPAAYGITVKTIEDSLMRLIRSGKVVGVDFAEFNPTFDDDSTSSKVAGRLIHSVLSLQSSL